ncbi:hypothetical protein BJ684DRAFT_17035, partial [Piptocephalis cylindrospora]
DVKTLAHASANKAKDRGAYKEALSKVHDQLDTGSNHLAEARKKLRKDSHGSFSQKQALEVMENLRRSSAALPYLIEAMKVIQPKRDDAWRITNAMTKKNTRSHVDFLITLFKKKDFTDANDYAAAAKIDANDYYDLRAFEKLLVVIPQTYHMLRIASFLQEVLQRPRSLSEARTSESKHPAIGDRKYWLAATAVPLMSVGMVKPHFEGVEALQNALHEVEQLPNAPPKANEGYQYYKALQSLREAKSTSYDVAQTTLGWITSVTKEFSGQLRRHAHNG